MPFTDGRFLGKTEEKNVGVTYVYNKAGSSAVQEKRRFMCLCYEQMRQ